MEDKEINYLCQQLWGESTGWHLSYDELIKISYSHGADGKGSSNGFEDKPYDIVYTSETGASMTRCTCSNLLNDWCSYKRGFLDAYKHLKGK